MPALVRGTGHLPARGTYEPAASTLERRAVLHNQELFSATTLALISPVCDASSAIGGAVPTLRGMQGAVRPPNESAAPPVRGRLFARVVTQSDVPLCTVEAELRERGAHVTRLLADQLLPGPSLAGPTFELLGKLYDGLIVPRAEGYSIPDIAVVSGVPVVFDDQDATALNA